jgi:hypothetical protein
VTSDQLSRPLLAGLAIAGLLALTGADAANPVPVRAPPSRPAPGAALLRDLAILELRARAAAERLEWLDVGVSRVPPPFRARPGVRIASAGEGTR